MIWLIPTWQARYQEIANAQLVTVPVANKGVRLQLCNGGDPVIFWTRQGVKVLDQLEVRGVHVDRELCVRAAQPRPFVPPPLRGQRHTGDQASSPSAHHRHAAQDSRCPGPRCAADPRPLPAGRDTGDLHPRGPSAQHDALTKISKAMRDDGLNPPTSKAR